jgi:uncharacterized protein YhaN
MSSESVDPRAALEKQFRLLEKRIDAVVAETGRLQRRCAALEQKLAQSERVRAEAAERIEKLLDKIDRLP